tara:strand:- start:3412 stop:4938 length:1527 start_codon:yes stop_codon:yes gene_type:complete
MHDEFVNRKHGRSPVKYPHKLLEEVLEETYGVIVYQEQVMEAARVLAGFSLGQADILRRAMGKKKKEEMEEQREIFIKGCKKNDITANNAEQIFDLINQFAEYGFNKSHSAAYALISYQTAYLKTYYPEHFMAAVLSSELGNTDKIYALIQECSRMKINILTPNILTSKKRFIVNQDFEIEYGLGAIKGVADAFIDHICLVREKNHFKDLWSFSKKIDVKLGGKKSLEALSQSGAFDSLAPSRTIAIKSVQDMLKDGANNNSNLQSGDLFSSVEQDFDPYEKYENIKELTLTEKLELEKKSLGYYLSGHPVLAIENKLRKIRSKKINELSDETKHASLVCLINTVRSTKDRKGKPLTFINFNDGTGTMDGIISSEILENCHDILKEGEILSLKGIVEPDNYRTGDLGTLMFRMRVREVLTIDSELNKKVKEIIIDINNSKINSLQKFAESLDIFDKDFWENGTCRLNVRVTSDQSQAIVDIGDEFKFTPSLESFFKLEEVFGKDILEI